MVISVNTNSPSLFAQNEMSKSNSALGVAIERLSSGLRVNRAKDDAAGMAIANRMEANLRADSTVSRGINDGISLVQVAGGGLDTINDLLQRGRVLAVQASNGTLSDADRASVNAEYKLLRAEIDRVATITEAFGKFPLAPGPRSAEPVSYGETKSIKDVFVVSGTTLSGQPSGVKPVGFIPTGATNVKITVDGLTGAEDDIQLFSRDGQHLVGTPVLGGEADYVWRSHGISTAANLEQELFKEDFGFAPDTLFNGAAPLLHFADTADKVFSADLTNGIQASYKGMTFTYTGDGDRFPSDTDTTDGSTDASHTVERLQVDKTTEPLFLAVVGQGIFNITAEWDSMPDATTAPPADKTPYSTATDIVVSASFGQDIGKVSIKPTPADSVSLGLADVELDPWEKAQEAMGKLQEALQQVDTYRGQYGALHNRFESAIANVGLP